MQARLVTGEVIVLTLFNLGYFSSYWDIVQTISPGIQIVCGDKFILQTPKVNNNFKSPSLTTCYEELFDASSKTEWKRVVSINSKCY